jgi:hypothetical protein
VLLLAIPCLSQSFYEVSAIVFRSNGYRYSVYKCGEECHALYQPAGYSDSIYYEEDGEDLHIRLLFRTIDRAEDFQTALNSFASEHPHFAEKLRVTRDISVVSACSALPLQRVMRTDYESSNANDSPEMRLNDVISDSASVISLTDDTVNTLQALEDISVVAQFGSLWFRCHLIPSGSRDRLKEDPDNFIYASWPLHQQLDGLTTAHGIGLAISIDPTSRPIEEEVSVHNGYAQRWRVGLLLHFESIIVANIFKTFLKPGTERRDDLCFKSFIHVRNHVNFSKCIVQRLEDQKKKSSWVKSLGVV